MLHLCFIHIYDFRVLNGIDVSFDHRYTFRVSEGVLTIRRADVLPQQFWGRGVHSLTAIMGNNGAGKTTALRFLMNALVDGNNAHEAPGVIVYEEGGRLYIYQPPAEKWPQLRIDSEVDYEACNLKKKRTLYYSGHFQPYRSAEDADEFETSGNYVATDQWLLIRDLMDYSNVDSLHMSHSLFSHLSAYHAQNQYRICELLAMQGLEELMPDFRWPVFIVFGPNLSALAFIEEQTRLGRTFDIPQELPISEDNDQISIGRLIYNNVLCMIAENRGDKGELESLLHEWQKTKKVGAVLDSFEAFVANFKLSAGTYDCLKSEIYVLRKLMGICHYSRESNVFYLNVEREKELLQRLNDEIFRSNFYLTARFFDMFYTHGLSYYSKLSSGEQAFLNLLSRLYYGITLQPMRKGDDNPSLILLDEAEIGFHPNWQRQYIDLVLKFLQMMMVRAGVDFQVVITSHSPIILSDIPRCCVTFIRRDENSGLTANKEEEETYGENVFNLYRRAFFMEDGLVGSFASARLRQLFDKAHRGESDDDMMKEVELIGDERIKDALLYEIGNHNYDAARNYYQQKLDELERRRADEENRPE